MSVYRDIITLVNNDRGIWDLDVSKGCASGLRDDPRGCYGDCYAASNARIYGRDFSKTVLRHFKNRRHERQIVAKINKVDMSFIRIGCSGDPSENWEHTLSILRKISKCNKEIVIITKHWEALTDAQSTELSTFNVLVNTSVSALDNDERRERALSQYHRLKPLCKSFLRIVSCDFNQDNETGKRLADVQRKLFLNDHVIDTVFRPSKKNPLVADGIINIKRAKFLGSTSWVSKFNRKTYLGACGKCKEQCGVFKDVMRRKPVAKQLSMAL